MAMTSHPGPVVEPPSLRSLTETISSFALTAAGLVYFLPAGVLLAASGEAQARDWLAWLIPLSVWASGFLPRLRPARAVVQVGAGLLLVLMSLAVPEGPSWLPVSIVTFAVIVAAVFTLRTLWAAVVIALATALDLAVAQSHVSTVGLFGVGLITPWAGALLNVLAGGGLLIAWTAWLRNVNRADEEFEGIKAALAVEEQARAAQTGAEAVRRRIHETLLNTLAGLSMGLPAQAQVQAEAACRRDVEQLDRGLESLADSSLSTVVAAAQQALEPTALTCRISIEHDALLAAGTANALRDAITESLRNVERHSGVLHASIRADVGDDDVIVVISDRGRGPAPSDQERFGVRNAVRANLAAIGGSASLSRGADGGTDVILHAPLAAPTPMRVPTFPVLGLADSTVWGRLGVTGTNIYMAIMTPVIVSEFALPGLTTAVIALYVACVLALALLWTSRAKSLLLATGAVLLPMPFIITGMGGPTCMATPGSLALVTGMTGGGVMLILIAAPRTWMRVLITALAIGSSIWLALQLPPACGEEVLLTAAVTATYMIALTIGLAWIDLRFEAQRTAAQQEWERLLDERIARERRSAEDDSWMLVRPSTRSLLEGIGSGRIRVTDPTTRARASAEAEILRADLGLSNPPSATLDSLASALTDVAVRAGGRVEVESLIPGQREDPLPRPVLSLLRELIEANRPDSVSVRSLVDEEWEEFVVVMPASEPPAGIPGELGDVVIEMELDSGALHISIRRPLQSR